MMKRWNDKPYHSLDYMLRERYGEKVYRVALNGGMSCPNRDGTLGKKGCIFCSQGGSGDFAASASLSITEQIDTQIASLSSKRPIHKYIAYFQAYTNTYAPVEYLKKIFTEAISHPDIVALSIGTRPDCLGDDVMELLYSLNQIKPVWVELGLQTIHEKTARYIRRGYSLSCFDDAVNRLRAGGIEVIVHTILGLPGEILTTFWKPFPTWIKWISRGSSSSFSTCLRAQILPEIMKQGFSGHMTVKNTWIL